MTLVIDDISLVPQAICFAGDSLILTKNIQTNEIFEIEARNLLSDKHEVFSVGDHKFIPVIYNIVTGPVNRFKLIKKDAIGINQPDHDFYVTTGHKIVINGIETKAKNIPQAKTVKIKPQEVYSICCEKHQPILINNLPVIAWGHNEWIKNFENKNIVWKNNKLE